MLSIYENEKEGYASKPSCWKAETMAGSVYRAAPAKPPNSLLETIATSERV